MSAPRVRERTIDTLARYARLVDETRNSEIPLPRSAETTVIAFQATMVGLASATVAVHNAQYQLMTRMRSALATSWVRFTQSSFLTALFI